MFRSIGSICVIAISRNIVARISHDRGMIARICPRSLDYSVAMDGRRLDLLRELERKVLWLSSWTIHHANHLRPKRDGLKVGGHQASCSSVVTLLSALYLDVLRPQDRVAVKPHASPVFHALQYLLGNQTRDALERFRALGGAQSYPSRTKDADGVDFSTGSVGLGVAMTLFASLAQDYLRAHALVPDSEPPGRMIALAGDAELDEGNVFEALLEGWKHDARNVWWIVDYNRQSLDAVVEDRLWQRIDTLFSAMGWRVVTLKYGRELEAAFARKGGDALRDWIDACPNSLYSSLVYRGGSAFRSQLLRELGDTSGIKELLDDYDDARLARAAHEPRRQRHGVGARRVPLRATTSCRPASSPTPSRVTACRSPATRTTTRG